eukprot:25627-Eustigmatos_ZCMA.PRE.1
MRVALPSARHGARGRRPSFSAVACAHGESSKLIRHVYTMTHWSHQPASFLPNDSLRVSAGLQHPDCI